MDKYNAYVKQGHNRGWWAWEIYHGEPKGHPHIKGERQCLKNEIISHLRMLTGRLNAGTGDAYEVRISNEEAIPGRVMFVNNKRGR